MQLDTCEDLNILSHLEYELEDTEAAVPCDSDDCDRAAAYMSTMFAPCQHDGLKRAACTPCFEWLQQHLNGNTVYCGPCDDLGIRTKIIKVDWKKL